MPHLTTDDGVKLYYEETGKGIPIVFVHEFAGDYRSWEQQVRFFGRYYRCIAVNARGYATMGDMPQFWAWALDQGSEFGGLPPPKHGLALSVPHDRADLTHDPAEAARSDPRANTTIAVVATNARLDKGSASSSTPSLGSRVPWPLEPEPER